MERKKFLSKETATMAAQAAFFHLFLNNRHVSVSASEQTGTIEIVVYLEDEEEVTLPDGYVISYERTQWITSCNPDEPAFKIKRFIFHF